MVIELSAAPNAPKHHPAPVARSQPSVTTLGCYAGYAWQDAGCSGATVVLHARTVGSKIGSNIGTTIPRLVLVCAAMLWHTSLGFSFRNL
jgi:hypothetical protein